VRGDDGGHHPAFGVADEPDPLRIDARQRPEAGGGGERVPCEILRRRRREGAGRLPDAPVDAQQNAVRPLLRDVDRGGEAIGVGAEHHGDLE
jgi:hypothetical protein